MSETFINCATVCCVLMPCEDGLVLIRRGAVENDGYGELALPGGFQTGRIIEPVRIVAARELQEETGIIIADGDLKSVNIETDEYGHNVAFFEYVGPSIGPWQEVQQILSFDPTEILGVELVRAPVETAFPFHTLEVRKWFERRTSAGKPS